MEACQFLFFHSRWLFMLTSSRRISKFSRFTIPTNSPYDLKCYAPLQRDTSWLSLMAWSNLDAASICRVIRHSDVQPAKIQLDKFRLQIFEYGLQKVIGQKEIIAVLQPSRKEHQQVPMMSKDKSTTRSLTSQRTENSGVTVEQFTDSGLVGQQGPSLWVIIMAAVCIIALVLPLEGDKYKGSVPHYLLLSVNQKLLASFILGLITMAVLKTWQYLHTAEL